MINQSNQEIKSTATQSREQKKQERIKAAIGKKYNKLTIISAEYVKRTNVNKYHMMCQCQCECGNIITCREDALKNGMTKSCGCLKTINIDNIVGKKLGKLTVLETFRETKEVNESTRKHRTRIRCKCQCECGNIVIVNYDAIRTGETQSCGCSNRIDFKSLINKKIGRLTIIRPFYKGTDRHKKVRCACKCDCGNIKIIDYSTLQKQTNISCGCLNKINTAKKDINQYTVYNELNKIWNSIKKQSSNEWKISFNNFFDWSLQNNYFSDAILVQIDSQKEYSPENCKWLNKNMSSIYRTNSRLITLNNITLTLTEWCLIYEIPYNIVYTRINSYKWDIEKALTTPVQQTYKTNQINKQKNPSNLINKRRLLRIWNGIKKRCCNPQSTNYKRYGGRGIKICEEWLKDYYTFEAWALNNGYQDNLTIDRIDNDGNYEPNNCRWTTLEEQANNKSSNIFITIDDETKTLAQWCKQYNLSYTTIYERIVQSNWEPVKALTTPIRSNKKN